MKATGIGLALSSRNSGVAFHNGKVHVASREPAQSEKVLEGESALSLGLSPEQRGKQLKLVLEVGVSAPPLLTPTSTSLGQKQPPQPSSSEKMKVRELGLDL